MCNTNENRFFLPRILNRWLKTCNSIENHALWSWCTMFHCCVDMIYSVNLICAEIVLWLLKKRYISKNIKYRFFWWSKWTYVNKNIASQNWKSILWIPRRVLWLHWLDSDTSARHSEIWFNIHLCAFTLFSLGSPALRTSQILAFHRAFWGGPVSF